MGQSEVVKRYIESSLEGKDAVEREEWLTNEVYRLFEVADFRQELINQIAWEFYIKPVDAHTVIYSIRAMKSALSNVMRDFFTPKKSSMGD